MKDKLAVQLYTLREECKQDFPAVLKELGEMGWAGVEFAGFHDHDPLELKAILDQNGLKASSLHVSYDEIINQPNQAAANAIRLGTKDIVCPHIGSELQNEAGYSTIKEELNRIAKEWKKQGLRLSYHNHAFEFETTIQGQNALSFLLDPANDNDILAEVDVYWVKKAGHDPLTFIQTYKGRMPMIHLKDMTDDAEQTFAEIGKGSIDFLPILRWGEASGVEWYVVEQDQCRTSPMDCIQTSYRNLTEMITKL